MNNLPLFPVFKPFTLDDIYWYRDFYLTAKLNPYADVHYENLLTWLNFNNDLSISKISDDTVVIKYTNPLNNNELNLIPLSKNLTDTILEKIFDYLSENNLPLSIQEIPSSICNNLSREKWQIEDYRDGFEYMLDTTQQIELESSDLSRQRRRINYFERENQDKEIEIEYCYEFNEEITKAFVHHIENSQLSCGTEPSKNNNHEATVIKRNLEFASIFHKKALLVKRKKEIIALAMISFLDSKTAVINHLKVDYSVQYIFQYALYVTAKKLRDYGIKEMNLEQDLGIEGLRIFKERLKPSRMLEKVIIKRL